MICVQKYNNIIQYNVLSLYVCKEESFDTTFCREATKKKFFLLALPLRPYPPPPPRTQWSSTPFFIP